MNFIENFNEDLIKGVTKKFDVTKKAIDSTIDETEKNLQDNLTSVLGKDGDPGLLDPLNKLLFTLLIKPFDRNAKLTSKDNSTLKIIGMSIILLITTTYNYIVGNTLSTNNYVVANSVGKVVSLSEKVVGYRTDGRRIGPETKPSAKIPLLFKIIIKYLLNIYLLLTLVNRKLVNCKL